MNIVVFVSAQQWPDQFISKIYTKKDGLWGNYVEQIKESKSGELYVLNNQGVLRYNGKSFETVIPRGKLEFNSRIAMELVDDKIVLAVANRVYVYDFNGKLIASKKYNLSNCIPTIDIAPTVADPNYKPPVQIIGNDEKSVVEIDDNGYVYFYDKNDVVFASVNALEKVQSVSKLAGEPLIGCAKNNYVPAMVKYRASGMVKDNLGRVYVELNKGGLFTMQNNKAITLPFKEKFITDVFVDAKNQFWVQNNTDIRQLVVYDKQGKLIQSINFGNDANDLYGSMSQDRNGFTYATCANGVMVIDPNFNVSVIPAPEETKNRNGEQYCFSNNEGIPFCEIGGLVYLIQEDKTLKPIYCSYSPNCMLPFRMVDSYGSMWFSDCSYGLVKVYPSRYGLEKSPDVVDSRLIYWTNQGNYLNSNLYHSEARSISHLGSWNIAKSDTLLSTGKLTTNVIYQGDTAVYLMVEDNKLNLIKHHRNSVNRTPLKNGAFSEGKYFGFLGMNRPDGYNDLFYFNGKLYFIDKELKKEGFELRLYKIQNNELVLQSQYKLNYPNGVEVGNQSSTHVRELTCNSPNSRFYQVSFYNTRYFLKAIRVNYLELDLKKMSFVEHDFRHDAIEAIAFEQGELTLFTLDSMKKNGGKLKPIAEQKNALSNERNAFGYRVLGDQLLLFSRTKFYVYRNNSLVPLKHEALSFVSGVFVIGNNEVFFRNEKEFYWGKLKQNNDMEMLHVFDHAEVIERYIVAYSKPGDNQIRLIYRDAYTNQNYTVSITRGRKYTYTKPVIRIVNLLLDNDSTDYKGVSSLSYYQNNLHFKLLATQTAEGGDLHYSYRIKGITQEWSVPQQDPVISFTGLAPGEYVFQFKAILPQYNLSSKVLEVKITINWPFWRTNLAYAIYIVLLGFLVYTIINFRTKALRKRQEILENTVKERTLEVTQQKDILAQKNKEIIDSINYAKRIQNAILPPFHLIERQFSDAMVMYLPKDIVAGDFYWMEKKEDTFLLAVADCTGHGVPGAMVSVVCHNALNRSVREFGLTDPGKILNQTRAIVINEFDREMQDIWGDEVKHEKNELIESGVKIQDGMDIALCAINGNKLYFAGANNPVWIVRGSELIELKGQKQPIGKFDNAVDFESKTFELLKGDLIYLFSDGYADQFGGDKGKKMKYANLQKYLQEIAKLPLKEQQQLLHDNFEKWRGDLEQVDDVCIMGIRI